MKSKNTITLSLMSASIALLLVLQVLWLRNAYEKAFYDLRRDTNFLFRSTLLAVRDSLFVKNIHPAGDSLMDPAKVESVQVWKRSGHDSVRIAMKSSTAQIFVNSTGNKDSLIRALQPMARHFNRPIPGGQTFIVRLSPDTVSLDSLEIIFNNALQTSGLPVKFLLQHDQSFPERFGEFRERERSDIAVGKRLKEHRLSVLRDTLLLEPVRLNPMNSYTASLLDFQGFILKAIAPQILFSLLLTTITILAFIVLYKSLRSQQRLMELKNDFISNVSHELKTPVATVSVALEALKNFHALNDPKLTQEYLDIAQKELNRLTLMTDKILKSAVFEHQGITLQNEPVDLSTIIAQVIDSMKLVLDKHQAETIITHEGNDFTVHGSHAHLTNVVYNLVDNALKYSRQQPRLTIHLTDKPSEVMVSIQDNGLGIAPEYKKKIFEKFFRVPTGDIHNIKGYGLGLSYVFSVVKEHQGRIEVISEPGMGSTFTLHLPKKHV